MSHIVSLLAWNGVLTKPRTKVDSNEERQGVDYVLQLGEACRVGLISEDRISRTQNESIDLE